MYNIIPNKHYDHIFVTNKHLKSFIRIGRHFGCAERQLADICYCPPKSDTAERKVY